MREVFILTVHLFSGFTMMPLGSLDACQTAMAGLPIELVADAECYPMEMIVEAGSKYAPEMSPRPKPKTGRNA